jgi:phosphatidylethanolamine-binding protein
MRVCLLSYVVLCYVQNSTGVTPPAGFDAANRTNFNVTQFVDSVHGNNFTLLAATFFFVSANDVSGLPRLRRRAHMYIMIAC